MDRLAEKLAEWMGSTPFILLHIIGYGGWIILHLTTGRDEKWATLTIFAGVEVIFLTLFILRAETIQTKRFEGKVRKDLQHSKRMIKEVHKKTKRSK